MGNDSPQPQLKAEDQYRLAKLLLQEYDIFHPFLERQMQLFTIACCNISLGGEVKLEASSKIITYDIKTEKKFKKSGDKLTSVKNSKIGNTKYKNECNLAKLNLTEWTRQLLWGEGTTVRVYVDGKYIE